MPLAAGKVRTNWSVASMAADVRYCVTPSQEQPQPVAPDGAESRCGVGDRFVRN